MPIKGVADRGVADGACGACHSSREQSTRCPNLWGAPTRLSQQSLCMAVIPTGNLVALRTPRFPKDKNKNKNANPVYGTAVLSHCAL
ncbi:hypothetical protein VTK73DRAFT_496 [Phialemonium thermophilum]|uniref:Uncharacterized protein n=1 Tax=Phialemonium thermophilum TaxID=223376 RepID=A0ABR3VUX2_9PEZI